MKQSASPPIYSQVAFDIASKIVSGEIKVGERFTGRSLMGSQYGVSPETIRRAMRHLGDMGIVSTQNNVGSTVLSQKRAVEYVEQYQAGNDLRSLKASLREMVARRDALNEQISQTFNRIMDLSERFRHSDRLRTYEFQVSDGPTAGRSHWGGASSASGPAPPSWPCARGGHPALPRSPDAAGAGRRSGGGL